MHQLIYTLFIGAAMRCVVVVAIVVVNTFEKYTSVRKPKVLLACGARRYARSNPALSVCVQIKMSHTPVSLWFRFGLCSVGMCDDITWIPKCQQVKT